MQAQCPHYMVKADGSDGAVMYDTLQAFCRLVKMKMVVTTSCNLTSFFLGISFNSKLG